jgi:hypothetical protein
MPILVVHLSLLDELTLTLLEDYFVPYLILVIRQYFKLINKHPRTLPDDILDIPSNNPIFEEIVHGRLVLYAEFIEHQAVLGMVVVVFCDFVEEQVQEQFLYLPAISEIQVDQPEGKSSLDLTNDAIIEELS